MKKIKEFLLLLLFVIVPFALFFMLTIPSPFVAGSEIAFSGGIQYLKLILKDKIFLLLIINTVQNPFLYSLILTPIACFILKFLIKFTRKNFYLTAFITSFVISAIVLIATAALYNLLGFIFLPMSMSFLCLTIFWIFEQIAILIKGIIIKKNVK